MSFFVSGQPLPDSGVVPRQLLLEEAWGELWDATNKDGKLVFVVGYTTPEGDEMFEEALGGLKRWEEVAPKACPHLLKILQICEGAIPYTVVENPGGYSLRTAVMEQPEMLPLKELGRIAGELATAVVEGAAYDLAPVGITPDIVFRQRDDPDHPWRVLPVGPRSRMQLQLLCDGRYAPPPPEPPDPVHLRNIDCYSVACILYDMFRRDFVGPRPPVKETVPFRGLRFTLESMLKDKMGIYGEPRVLVVGLDRWTKKMIDEDYKELEEIEKRRREGQMGALRRVWSRNKTAVKVGATIFLLLAGLGSGIYFTILHGNPFKTKASLFYPKGTAEIFLTGLIKGDMTPLLDGGLDGYGQGDVDAIARAIKRMENRRRIATFAYAEATMTGGDGNQRYLYAKLFDSAGTEFGLVSAKMYLTPAGKWTVQSAFFKPAADLTG